MPPMLMQHKEEPRDVLFKKVGMKDGQIPGFKLFGNRILVGIYERPSVTRSGIHLSDQTLREELHQGKAGIVLAMGHSAFQSDDQFSFGPDKVAVGDYVMLFVSHGLSCNINGVPCRLVRDQDITMRIPMPDAVF